MAPMPEPYDLIAILAGDKSHRHPPAIELMRRGWARYVAVTGEHEQIEPTAALDGLILTLPTSTSTYEDALSIRILADHRRFSTILVVTSASQCDRARLVIARAFRHTAVTVDLLAWEVASAREATRTPFLVVLRQYISEACKLVYYRALRRL